MLIISYPAWPLTSLIMFSKITANSKIQSHNKNLEAGFLVQPMAKLQYFMSNLGLNKKVHLEIAERNTPKTRTEIQQKFSHLRMEVSQAQNLQMRAMMKFVKDPRMANELEKEIAKCEISINNLQGYLKNFTDEEYIEQWLLDIQINRKTIRGIQKCLEKVLRNSVSKEEKRGQINPRGEQQNLQKTLQELSPFVYEELQKGQIDRSRLLNSDRPKTV